MTVALAIKQRLAELGVDQRDLARAAGVTESYISQLLTHKKLPPSPRRTQLYEKIASTLQLPSGQLAALAEIQRRERLTKSLGGLPTPLFADLRAWLLGKCHPKRQRHIRTVFEAQSFGEIERFVTQTLLSVGQRVCRQARSNAAWLQDMAHVSRTPIRRVRAAVQALLDATILTLPKGNGVSVLDALIDSWDIDIHTFSISIVLNRRVATDRHKTFILSEQRDTPSPDEEAGLEEFLKNPTLSRGITEEETAFLRRLHFVTRRPTPLYYYRELQSLRDPLHFTLPRQRPAS